MRITALNVVLTLSLSLSVSAMAQQTAAPEPAQKPATPAAEAGQPAAKAEKDWRPLLPKTGLDGWEITDFINQGPVVRQGDGLLLEAGDPLTGIHYTRGDFPKTNFEIELEAQRIEGNDFLCGLTFPVGDEFCSFIAGGWGGGLVGLSSVDGYDASENSTSNYHDFKNGKWYKFRVAVDDQAIRAWIDDREYLMQERDNHEFNTRIEVYASQPLGFCTFDSKVAVRNFRWRPLPSSGKE